MAFFANLFGYILQFLYNITGSYGWAIILFSILVKVLMIPLTAKQQKALKKNEQMQEEMKQLQFKYKNDQEKMNQELMALYKRDGFSPFSGCFSSIIQIVLIFSVFLLVRSPLTYMVKMDPDVINKMEQVVNESDTTSNKSYAEIAIIQYIRNLEKPISVSEEENGENKEDSDFNIYDYKDQANLNMDFLGIDLSQVPTQNLKDFRVYIIPGLYVISSFISIKMTTASSKKKSKDNKLITDGKASKEEENYNPMEEANKTMAWMMPIMAVSIAVIAPLGLALYWLMSNVLMIVEKIIFNKIFDKEEKEAVKNA